MEFRDLKTQYIRHKEAIDGAIAATVANGQFIGGGPVAQLEEALADYVGVKYCISCANGTDALLLSLMAWGVGEGDAVFVPDFTFFSTAEVVPWVGATPVFVDIDADTFNMSPQALEKAVRGVKEEGRLTPRAVIAVDLFGQPAEYEKIREIAKEYGLLLMEDGAQGFGGRIGERKACSFGDISTTSFFPAKPLGCYGDGGAVFTDNDEWAELIRSYKVHGKGFDKYDNIRIGMNSRLDTIQAAVLLEKLRFFDEELESCNRVAAAYTGRLQDKVKTPTILQGYYSGWAQYTVRFSDEKQREEAILRLKEAGIPSMVYYRKPMHALKAFEHMQTYKSDCRTADEACRTCLSLPMHAYLQESELDQICKLV
ncbi:MAG: DegT/DnrJ/EryC1/StrS family aminotransferase [Lachnospiraceae bacterium]|nr:DegT/DnrJ/EryC1/StrS family aminotransferase [Lachnospiraceae bacterium]